MEKEVELWLEYTEIEHPTHVLVQLWVVAYKLFEEVAKMIVLHGKTVGDSKVVWYLFELDLLSLEGSCLRCSKFFIGGSSTSGIFDIVEPVFVMITTLCHVVVHDQHCARSRLQPALLTLLHVLSSAKLVRWQRLLLCFHSLVSPRLNPP